MSAAKTKRGSNAAEKAPFPSVRAFAEWISTEPMTPLSFARQLWGPRAVVEDPRLWSESALCLKSSGAQIIVRTGLSDNELQRAVADQLARWWRTDAKVASRTNHRALAIDAVLRVLRELCNAPTATQEATQ